MGEEKILRPISGLSMLMAHLLFLALSTYLLSIPSTGAFPLWGILLSVAMAKGYFNVQPGDAKAILLFGEYVGTVKKGGFYWVNIFAKKVAVSIKTRVVYFDNLSALDKASVPIELSGSCSWRVGDTCKALFEVDDISSFMSLQFSASLRRAAASFDAHAAYKSGEQHSLAKDLKHLQQALEEELSDKAAKSGVVITEAKISSYSVNDETLKHWLKNAQLSQKLFYRRAMAVSAVDVAEEVLKRALQTGKIPLNDENSQRLAVDLIVALSQDSEQ